MIFWSGNEHRSIFGYCHTINTSIVILEGLEEIILRFFLRWIARTAQSHFLTAIAELHYWKLLNYVSKGNFQTRTNYLLDFFIIILLCSNWHGWRFVYGKIDWMTKASRLLLFYLKLYASNGFFFPYKVN